MVAHADRDGYRGAVKALIDIFGGDGLQDFATAFVQGTIETPQGWTLPEPELKTTHTFTKSGNATFKARPLTITRGSLRFEGGPYTIAAKSQGRAPRFHVEDAWSSDPKSVAACEDDVDVPYALFETGDKNVDVTVTATKKKGGASACGCTRVERDPCLVGSWVLDDQVFGDLIYEIVARGQPTGWHDRPAINGSAGMSFARDGSSGATFDDLEIAVSTSRPAAFTVMTTKGAFEGGWLTKKGEIPRAGDRVIALANLD